MRFFLTRGAFAPTGSVHPHSPNLLSLSVDVSGAKYGPIDEVKAQDLSGLISAVGTLQIVGPDAKLNNRIAKSATEVGYAVLQAKHGYDGVIGGSLLLALNTDDANTDKIWQAIVEARNAYKAGCKHFISIEVWAMQEERVRLDMVSNAGISGLMKTVAAEWADANFAALQIEMSSDDACLKSALKAMKSGHKRYVTSDNVSDITFEPIEITSKAHNTEMPENWLVTGGARGVTSACVVDLARRAGGHFVLLGRTKIEEWPAHIAPTQDLGTLRKALALASQKNGEAFSPKHINKRANALLASAEIRATLESIASVGARAEYVPCDISDAKSVEVTLAQLSARYGEFAGLIHGAGVIKDRLINQKTRDEFDMVYGIKMGGFRNILASMDVNALTHIGLFSSASAIYGNVGQADYAMANAGLNFFVDRMCRIYPDKSIHAFNWGPWHGGMVDDTLANAFEKRGIPLIPLDEGAAIFSAIMAAKPGQYPAQILVGGKWDG